MKVIVAPDSWKECLTAPAAAAAIARGVRRACPDAEIVELPVADGGEGTCATLVAATGGRFLDVPCEGPLGEPLRARIGVLGDGTTAVVEMAAAAGLELVPPDRRAPLAASTFGVGLLLRAALDAGAARIVLGLGGSATTDGGAGFAQALGYRLLDDTGKEIPRGGGGLEALARIDATGRDPRLPRALVEVACDVDHPLIGPRGAAHVFGPQKGATPVECAVLDAGLRRLAAVVRRDLGLEIAEFPGGGAAGGLGAGALAFAGGALRRGIDLALDAAGFERALAGAELCLTGEGALDATTAGGKAVAGVARRCRAVGVACVALAGSIALTGGELADLGLSAAFAAALGPATLEDSKRHAAERLAAAAEQAARLWRRARAEGQSSSSSS